MDDQAPRLPARPEDFQKLRHWQVEHPRKRLAQVGRESWLASLRRWLGH